MRKADREVMETAKKIIKDDFNFQNFIKQTNNIVKLYQEYEKMFNEWYRLTSMYWRNKLFSYSTDEELEEIYEKRIKEITKKMTKYKIVFEEACRKYDENIRRFLEIKRDCKIYQERLKISIYRCSKKEVRELEDLFNEMNRKIEKVQFFYELFLKNLDTLLKIKKDILERIKEIDRLTNSQISYDNVIFFPVIKEEKEKFFHEKLLDRIANI